MSDDDRTPGDELVALQAKQAKREADRKAAIVAQDLELARLVDKLEESTGPINVDFAIVDVRDLGCGLIAVRRPDGLVHKRWMVALDKANTKKMPVDDADFSQYTTPNIVHPDRTAYLTIITTRPEIAGRCARAQMDMMGVRKSTEEGKY